VFGALKGELSGRKFRSDKKVQVAMHDWLCKQPKDFFSRGIRALVKRWNKRTERTGDYVEK
jgi:hypothetical protein